ncbi:MAG: SMI1/KNR4 family protein [Phycisphaerae bacterium]|nr:SMI1/KNR4 family protein [Phycisphaerae bacterium]MCK6497911.1 SMI1/KNR4 family protein [Nitrospira sp.]
MSALRQELDRILAHLAHRGFETRELVFDRPARQREVERVEGKLSFELPPRFREVLLTVSRRVGFWWFAPDDVKFPDPFCSNFSGQLKWSLEDLPDYEEARAELIESVFPSVDDPYDVVWHDKLAFAPVGNGDYLAIDLSPAHYEQVVYLSHDDGEGHGYVLANDFADLLRRWTPLACPGAEDWQWLPFTRDGESGIDPACENARIWQRLLGLTP